MNLIVPIRFVPKKVTSRLKNRFTSNTEIHTVLGKRGHSREIHLTTHHPDSPMSHLPSDSLIQCLATPTSSRHGHFINIKVQITDLQHYEPTDNISSDSWTVQQHINRTAKHPYLKNN